MQELNELKNLVIQSLEANGSLSNIRAQIRASVFKVIDQQSPAEAAAAAAAGPGNKRPAPKASPYAWENSKSQQVLQEQNGLLVLSLIKEFLQFYQMDYSNSVFSSEVNLREEVKRDSLKQELPGLSSDQQKPLLLQMLDQFKGSASNTGSASQNINPAVPRGSSERNENDIQNSQKIDERIVSSESSRSKKSQDNLNQQEQTEVPPAAHQSNPQLKNSEDVNVNAQNKFNSQGTQEQYSKQPAEIYGSDEGYSEEEENSERKNQLSAQEQEYLDEGVEEQLNQYGDDEDQDLQEDLTESQFKQRHAANQFEDSEDFIGQSSKGQDISVDSYQLDEFDYVTDVDA